MEEGAAEEKFDGKAGEDPAMLTPLKSEHFLRYEAPSLALFLLLTATEGSVRRTAPSGQSRRSP